LAVTGIGNRFSDTLRTHAGPFRVDLPSGSYSLSGFIDSDNDGKQGRGGVWPYRLAETSAISTDTVKVRARFETTGIKFTFR
jgi:hypothetical protein